MKIVTSSEIFVKYVTYEGDMNFDKFFPYINRVERDLQEIIGKELFNLIVSPVDEIQTEANEFACEYISNLALSQSLNAMKLKISNTGIKTSSPQNTDNPNWWDIKDLNRDLIRNANRTLNYLLKHFDENTTNFPAWKNAPIQKQNENLLIRDLEEFEQYFSLNGSFTTLIALRPYMRDAQLINIAKQLQGCYNSEDLTDEMMKNIKAALVNYTIANVADTGLFKLEENGALVKVELMPWEKSEKLSDKNLERLKDQRKEIAESYLKEALTEVSKLPCFTDLKPSDLLIIKKPSMLFLGKK